MRREHGAGDAPTRNSTSVNVMLMSRFQQQLCTNGNILNDRYVV